MSLYPAGPETDSPAFSTHWPANMEFGAGVAQTLPDRVRTMDGRCVLLMTDRGLHASGLVERIVSGLSESGLAVFVFDDIQPNPVIANAIAARAMWNQCGADTVVALGGGSVIDTSKVLVASIASDSDWDALLMQGDAAMVRQPPPFIVLPTTAGTGSESTSSALIKDSAGRKRLMRSLRARPTRVMLDPLLTLSVPVSMTAATGFDVLMHALGALSNITDNPIGEALAYEALALGVQHLPRVVQDPSSVEARSHMLLASYLAGLAISMKGVDAIHGLCTPLESIVDRPHGLVLSAIFPHVMRHNLGACQAVYAKAARLCGFAATDTPQAQAAQALYQGLMTLRMAIGLDVTLSALGVDASMLVALPDRALDTRPTQLNAAPLNREQISALYVAML